MQYAIRDGARVEPLPGQTALCPVCDSDVLAKCGSINAWHWSHRNRRDCDSWSEGETQWHRDSKSRFPCQWREVVVGQHRADIQTPRCVIEVQLSQLSPAAIAEREIFYGDMIWVVEASDFNLEIQDLGSHLKFRWKHPRKTWWWAQKPLFFDLGDQLLHVKKLYANLPCHGWGQFISYENFVCRFSKPRPGQQFCECCMKSLPKNALMSTGMTEYYQLDLDPETLACWSCLDRLKCARIPDDLDLCDVYTPMAV
tara:strand:+ start:10167 stop:10931 length:765 start_codon:yes stop_codon:yes gene_type:complete